MSIFQELIRTHRLKTSYPLFLFIMATTIVSFCTVLITRMTGAIGQAAIEFNTDLIIRLLLLMAGATAVKMLLEIVSTLVAKRFAGRTQYALRRRFATTITGIPYRTLADKSSGDLLSIYTNDLPLAANLIAENIPQILGELITLLIATVFMILIHPWYTLIFFLLFPPLMYLQFKVSQPIQKFVADASAKRGMYNATVNDSLQNTAMVIAYSLEDTMEKRYQSQYQAYFAAQMKRILMFTKLIITGITATFIPMFFIFIASALAVVDGTMTVGNFIALTTIALSAISFLTMLSQRLSSMQTGRASARRLLDATQDELEEASGQTAAQTGTDAFSFENVSFTYSSNFGRNILQDINLTIPAGSKVAVVGTSGCGKSTLIKLMLSLFEQDQGIIRVFGADTRSMPRRQLRDLIAYVPQDSFLFPESIRENLTCVRRDGQDDDRSLIKACRDAGILSFIEGLPNGFDTVLTEAADNVSGGQRQRLAIARALYKDAPILLLDEATAGLDSVTEKALLETFLAATEGRTAVVVAHRLSAITACHRIVVMDKGRIVEDGTYQELMARDSVFADLYKQQAQEDSGDQLPGQEGQL